MLAELEVAEAPERDAAVLCQVKVWAAGSKLALVGTTGGNDMAAEHGVKWKEAARQDQVLGRKSADKDSKSHMKWDDTMDWLRTVAQQVVLVA